MMKKSILIATLGLLSFNVSAQDTPKAEEGFIFTTVKENPITSVKNQNRSSTCWSFSALGFLESELLRMGKGEYDLSEMFVVHHTMMDRGVNYVRYHGDSSFSPGGSFYDIMFCLRNYGLVPQEAMPGIMYGDSLPVHNELDAVAEAYTNAIAKGKLTKLTPVWQQGLSAIYDTYLGQCPEKFTYKGKEYTPKSFAQELGIRRDDYVVLTAMTHHPLYTAFPLEIPDNWNWSPFYNVTMEELGRIVDVSLRKGYAVNWASDVSENGFGFREGRAIVPVESAAEIPPADSARWKGLTDDEIRKRTLLKTGVLPERQITPEMRQQAFDRYETTDDHGMLLVGIAADQHGRKFYKVKNSWGETGLYKGYFYASEPFLLYKTVGIQVHREAIPQDIKDKLGIR